MASGGKLRSVGSGSSGAAGLRTRTTLGRGLLEMAAYMIEDCGASALTVV